MSKVFIPRYLARSVLIVTTVAGARCCSSDSESAKPRRRTAFQVTSMVDSDPRPARPGPPDATSCYVLKTPGPQRSNFRDRRLKFQLKLTWQPFAIGRPGATFKFKTPKSHRKMCAGMLRAARRPTYSLNSVNLRLVLLDLLDLLSSSRLLPVEVRTVTFKFSSDSSQKWSVTQNLSRSWRRAI